MRVGKTREARILFLTNHFPPGHTGGTEVINYFTCRGLIQRGIECQLLVTNTRMAEPLNERYVHDGIQVHRVGFHTQKGHALTDVFDWRVYHTVRAELRRYQPDLVHVHNVSGASLAPYAACRAVGIPVVNTLHDHWLLCPNNMLYRQDGTFCDPAQNPRGCRDCFRKYDFWGNIPCRRPVFAALTSNVRRFIAPSEALMRLHLDAGYAAERFRVVPHGLDDIQDQTVQHPAIRDLGTSRHQYNTLLFAGGGIEIKGANVLLEAIPLLERHVERLRIVVAGSGEARLLARFRQFAPVTRVLGQVPFPEMPPLFAAADLTLVPSTCAESFSLVTLESLRAGTPVVGSAFGAIPELVRHRDTGYLFSVGDPVALAEQVILHFARPVSVRRRMSQRCLQEARSTLSLEHQINGILQVYEEVLET